MSTARATTSVCNSRRAALVLLETTRLHWSCSRRRACIGPARDAGPRGAPGPCPRSTRAHPCARAPEARAARADRPRLRHSIAISGTKNKKLEEPSHNSGRRMRGRCRIKPAAFGDRIAGARVSSACARLPPPSRTDAVSVAVAGGKNVKYHRVLHTAPAGRSAVHTYTGYRPRKRNPTDCDSIIVNPSADRAAVFSTRARHTPGRAFFGYTEVYRELGRTGPCTGRVLDACLPTSDEQAKRRKRGSARPRSQSNPTPSRHSRARARRAALGARV